MNRKMMGMNKRMIMLLVTLAIITIYLVILINTNQVIRHVENVMRSNIAKDLTMGLPIDMYNRQGHLDLGAVSYEVKISRVFVIHNFFNGYMWVRYTREGFDSDGNRVYGSWKIPSRWKIQKQNGKWEIIDIFERL